MLEQSYYRPEEILKKWKYPCPICNKYQHDNFILDRIHKRMSNGENTNILIMGANRSGKSLTSMRIGWDATNMNFCAEENVKWDWLSLVKAYEHSKKNALVLEEIGVVYDRMNYYTDTNKYFKYLMETQAYLLNTLIMNVPDLDFVPRNLWSLLTYVIETKKFGKSILAIIKKVEPDRWKGKIRFRSISNWWVDMTKVQPSVIDTYLYLKDEWNKKNLQEWLDATRPKTIEQPKETELQKRMRESYARLQENTKVLNSLGIKF